jgi:hypothetical protein
VNDPTLIITFAIAIFVCLIGIGLAGGLIVLAIQHPDFFTEVAPRLIDRILRRDR